VHVKNAPSVQGQHTSVHVEDDQRFFDRHWTHPKALFVRTTGKVTQRVEQHVLGESIQSIVIGYQPSSGVNVRAQHTPMLGSQL
jgi:hypothetical protein